MTAKQPASWKPGRGKLGPLDPLLGVWTASAQSPMGPVTCQRTFSRILNGAYVLLDVAWGIPGKQYLEHAVYGIGEAGLLSFWSFTSDGKRSVGNITDASDVHVSAVAFEAQMPAGLARMIYWPAEDGGLMWAVESRSKKGWSRFTEHHYHRV